MPIDRLRGSIAIMRVLRAPSGFGRAVFLAKKTHRGLQTRGAERDPPQTRNVKGVEGVGNLRSFASALGRRKKAPSVFRESYGQASRIGRTSRTRKAEQRWAFSSAEVCDLGIATVVVVAQPNKRYIKHRQASVARTVPQPPQDVHAQSPVAMPDVFSTAHSNEGKRTYAGKNSDALVATRQHCYRVRDCAPGIGVCARGFHLVPQESGVYGARTY